MSNEPKWPEREVVDTSTDEPLIFRWRNEENERLLASMSLGNDWRRGEGSVLFTERKPASTSTYSNWAPPPPPADEIIRQLEAFAAELPAPSPTQFQIIVSRELGPGRLERERSRDGSCVNLSAIERNAKRLQECSRVLVDERNGRIYCAPHMKLAIEKEIGRTRVFRGKEGASQT